MLERQCPLCLSWFSDKDYRDRYCSRLCSRKAGRATQYEKQYLAYIQKWLAGEVTGNRGIGAVSLHVRRYLFEKYRSACSVCGWCEVHPSTGTVPLEVDHIDGNWENSAESNLTLLCPNHHALTPTYRNLNGGKGRPRKGSKGKTLEGPSDR